MAATNQCLAQSNKSRTAFRRLTRDRQRGCDEATEVLRPNLREEDMALMTGAECGQEISGKARSCPGGAAPVAGNSQNRAEKPRSRLWNPQAHTCELCSVQV